MPRPASGTLQRDGDRWLARVTLGAGTRRAFVLTSTSETDVRERLAVLARLAAALRAGGAPVETAARVLALVAEREGAALADAVAAAERIAAGGANVSAPLTFADVARSWIAGELHQRFPDHVPALRRVATRRSILERHLVPVVGDVPIAAFSLDDAQRALDALPSSLAPSSRAAIAGVLARVIALSVFPLRIREHSPIPRNWRPATGARRVRPYLYPAEDRALMACRAVPPHRRLLYGVLAREGMRVSEAHALTRDAIDLERGTVRLDQNKTDDARTWALGDDVVRALRLWFAVRERAMGRPLRSDELVFTSRAGKPLGTARAASFRRHLRRAGCERPELYARAGLRRPIRAHDLRGSFVTLALATGRSETWVADRTGHTSSVMIARYRRSARTAAEIGLGWFAPLDVAIPDLGTGNGSRNGSEGTGEAHETRENKGSEPDPGVFSQRNVVTSARHHS